MKLKISTLAIASFLAVTTIASDKALALNLETSQNSKLEDSNITSSISREEVIKWYQENGVDQETIDSLMKKLDNNELLDSINPSMKSKGIVTFSDENETRIVYPDGSISITGVEGGEINYVPQSKASISGGTTSSGSGYFIRKGAKVYNKSGILDMHFYADFTNVQRGDDKIDRVYDKKCKSYLGTWTLDTFKITKTFENLNGPATARFEVLYNATIGESSSTGNYYLELQVGKDTSKAVFK